MRSVSDIGLEIKPLKVVCISGRSSAGYTSLDLPIACLINAVGLERRVPGMKIWEDLYASFNYSRCLLIKGLSSQR